MRRFVPGKSTQAVVCSANSEPAPLPEFSTPPLELPCPDWALGTPWFVESST